MFGCVPRYGILVLGKIYGNSATFLSVEQDYPAVIKWAKLVMERPAVVRGKKVMGCELAAACDVGAGSYRYDWLPLSTTIIISPTHQSHHHHHTTHHHPPIFFYIITVISIIR